MNRIIAILVIFFSIYTANAEKPLLRWAADAESGAPYVFQDPRNPTELVGFEVDIINAIAHVLKYDNTHVQNQWDGLIPGLARNDYDIVINGLEITDDRERVVNFSIPYYITFEQLIVRKGVDDINSLAECVGKKVGTLKNSLAERILEAKGGIDVYSYESEVNSFSDLKNGRLDAVLIDEPVAKFYAGWNPEFDLVGQPIGEISYGIVVPKTNPVLLDKINLALKKIIASGKLREILERWNMWNITMASYLEDDKESNIPPTKYNDFLESQGKVLTFYDQIERYIGFAPRIIDATWMTLELSVLSMLLAMFAGLILALMKVYGIKPISWLASGIIELIRGTPLLIQLFFIYYALPEIGIELNAFFAAILGLGLNYAAYEAENYRAGLLSVPRGQMEAAIALGMTRSQALKNIIIPQAIRLVIPPMTNDFISLLKDSSLVSFITIVELAKVYGQLASTYYDYTGIGILIATIYLLLGLPFVKLSKMAERKLAIEKREK